MKPIIGIILRPMQNKSNRDVEAIYNSVKEAVIQKGGIPLGIILYHKGKPTQENIADLKILLSFCNGILLQGGEDFYPIDIWIANYAYEKDIPVLGICLGMQIMSCAQNGIMKEIKDASHQQIGYDYVHSVHIDKESLLYKIIKEEDIFVNSRHHSFIENTTLDKVGYAKDGVLEVVEDPDKRFFLGVQWHPEDMITYDKVANLLLEAFIEKCRE